MEGGVAVVTGAGKGIGRAIAINLAEEHFSVGLVGREPAALAEVAEACRALGVRAEFYPVDLRRIECIADLMPQIAEDLGGISVLVNNAGVCIERDIREATLADWDSTLDVNVRAVFALTKYALPYLERASDAAVINIASIAGHRTYPEGTMYSASKHGLLGLSGSLFHDVREQGIKVCAISPGYVNTDMHRNDSGLDPMKMIQPEDIADAVRFVVNFPARSCPTEITIMPQYSPKK
jgi:NADP-dependent 3-hydroxy acid dehydrogenase YdfG